MIHILRAARSLRTCEQPLTSALRATKETCLGQCRVRVILAAGAVAFASCGKVGPPVAPGRLTERTSQLSAVQRGGSILLSWPAPALVRNQSSRHYIARVDIYRVAERRNEEPILDPDDYEALAQVVGFMDRAAMEEQMKTLGHLQFADTINLTDPADLANSRLRYAVRYTNRRGQASVFSNTVAIEPFPGVARPPTNLGFTEAQDAITISWTAPASNVSGYSPASVAGYNVYRWSKGNAPSDEPINSEPITGVTFTDKRFQYLVEYVYVVRAISQGANGLVESADSEQLTLTPVDRFPPAAIDAVSVASANGTISLFWPSSPERDVIGYNVYRAGSADAPAPAWVKLNEQPLTAVTFRDDRVIIEQTYYYKVTAVDRFNNESLPSRVVHETAHP